MKKFLTLNILRILALVMLLVGAVVSLGLMYNAGSKNRSVLLVLLFAIWVLSPSIALLVANVVSKRWPVIVRVSLYSLMLFLTLGSLITYSGALNPSGTKPAFVFLIVPLISWLLIAIAIPIAVSKSRRLSRRSNKV